ncbi:MAG: ABC transporter permease [Nocardioidaceae bacterium]
MSSTPSSTLTGTLRLTRFELRRDRVLASVWVLLLFLMCYASASATSTLYASASERVRDAELINSSPATVALYGPILDVHSLGEFAMTKTTVTYAILVMALGLVLVRRHTRTEEETGRQELIAATLVGRSAPLASAVLEATVVMVALGVLAAAGDIVGGLPAAGSLLFGASWVGSGLVGIGIAAVACQLSASTRTSALVGSAAIGTLFLLRAVGDTTSASWLSWLSPFGWNTRLRAWSEPRVWVLLLYPVLAAALVAVAVELRGRRDLGSGLVAERPGPAEGSPRLRDVVALTLRVHAHALAAWTAASAVMGVVFGSIVPNLGSLFESAQGREMLARLGGTGAVEDAMLAGILSVVAMLLSAFAISVAVHGGVDESDGRTEQVLATATPRSLSFVAVLGVSVLGATWLLLVTGVATAIGVGVSGGGLADTFGRSLGAALAPTPAVWLVAALAVLCLSLGSRWATLGWAVLVFFVTVGLVGELLNLPGWVIGLSPYHHVPLVPSEPFAWAPELVLTLLSLAVAAVAWWRFTRRDIG